MHETHWEFVVPSPPGLGVVPSSPGLGEMSLGLGAVLGAVLGLDGRGAVLGLVALEGLNKDGRAVVAQDDQVTLDSRGTRFWRSHVNGQPQSITIAQPG